MKYDVVVIGSGLGGLVCAAVLARAGRSVLVLERQAQPGGCMQSYRRGPFSFDTGLHYVGALAPGQRLHRIFSYLGLMNLPWQRLDPGGVGRITIGGHTYAFAEGYGHFAEVLAREFPDESKALHTYVSMLQHAEEVPFGSDDAYRLFGVNAYEYLCSLFHTPALIDVLAGSALKMELRRESLPLFSFAHRVSGFIQSSWRLNGDGNMLVRQLVDTIREGGGEVLCRAEVEELVADSDPSHKRIVAARCKNGEVYEASSFISDAHPALTFDMVKAPHLLKNIFRRRMAMMQNTFGMLTVSLVVKPQTLRYFNHNKFVYPGMNVWDYEETGWAERPVDRVMVWCRPDPGSDYVRQVDLLTPMPWSACRQWENTTVGRRGDDYRRMKEEKAAECIALAETVIPGLGAMVEDKYVSTPLTYRDYTLTPEGSAYGVRKDCNNLVMTMLSPQTPVPNLLLTGQNLMLHGLEGVTMTAMLTCSALLGEDLIRQIVEPK